MTDFDDDFFEKHVRGKAVVRGTSETRRAKQLAQETADERAARIEKERVEEEELRARLEKRKAEEDAWWEAKNEEAGFSGIEVSRVNQPPIVVAPRGHSKPAVFIQDSKGLCYRCDSLEDVQLLLGSKEEIDGLIEALKRVRDVYFSE